MILLAAQATSNTWLQTAATKLATPAVLTACRRLVLITGAKRFLKTHRRATICRTAPERMSEALKSENPNHSRALC